MLYVMIGLPGSGKSSNLPDGHLISSDNIRWEITRYKETGIDWDESLEPKVWVTITRKFNSAIKKHDIVVYDATNTKREYRKPFIKTARKYGHKVTAIFMNVSLNIVLERNESRERTVPPEKIIEMYNEMNIPTLEEFDDIIIIDETGIRYVQESVRESVEV